ncbi:VOC family protein [Roseiconus nitratireducens]|uniref:VOC family protein n=1 Tax=Roseiconus nitratireducens TaxID=2605748 RepID=A0A5M6DAD4_9BACT|nr:VOC family protein [Roseiconus nitratireducens]KAA5544524.1 VOC family protein [Roseiconus nitratireducens]
MRFGYTLLYVRDVQQTLTFYESVFGLQRKMFHEEGDQAYGELDTGATTLGFVSYALAQSHGFEISKPDANAPPPPVEIALVTDDVPGAFATAVEKGAVEVCPPEKKPWGQIVSYVRDNNGFVVEICSPVAT